MNLLNGACNTNAGQIVEALKHKHDFTFCYIIEPCICAETKIVCKSVNLTVASIVIYAGLDLRGNQLHYEVSLNIALDISHTILALLQQSQVTSCVLLYNKTDFFFQT